MGACHAATAMMRRSRITKESLAGKPGEMAKSARFLRGTARRNWVDERMRTPTGTSCSWPASGRGTSWYASIAMVECDRGRRGVAGRMRLRSRGDGVLAPSAAGRPRAGSAWRAGLRRAVEDVGCASDAASPRRPPNLKPPEITWADRVHQGAGRTAGWRLGVCVRLRAGGPGASAAPPAAGPPPKSYEPGFRKTSPSSWRGW